MDKNKRHAKAQWAHAWQQTSEMTPVAPDDHIFSSFGGSERLCLLWLDRQLMEQRSYLPGSSRLELSFRQAYTEVVFRRLQDEVDFGIVDTAADHLRAVQFLENVFGGIPPRDHRDVPPYEPDLVSSFKVYASMPVGYVLYFDRARHLSAHQKILDSVGFFDEALGAGQNRDPLEGLRFSSLMGGEKTSILGKLKELGVPVGSKNEAALALADVDRVMSLTLR